MSDHDREPPPILRDKHYDHPSVFLPENLLREARRQKALPQGEVPKVCLLDPDGDLVRHLVEAGTAKLSPQWACYHTQLHHFHHGSIEFGIVGCAVGASFAVLVAEQLFASGCQLLISVTSSGQILRQAEPPFFVLIERALRDEGTSYHYLPPADYAELDAHLLDLIGGAFGGSPVPVYRGNTWTTDAPFRETSLAIAQAQAAGILAVEMEAAALYAFAQARRRSVVCFAYVTNQMGRVEGDFEKGEGDGSQDALEIALLTAQAWLRHQQPAHPERPGSS